MIIRAPFCWGLLLLVMQACCAQAPLTNADFFGRWTVQDVLCSGCGNRIAAEKGAVIELASGHIENPLAENCNGTPGYNLLNEMRAKQVVARYGNDWPPSVNRAVLKRSRVRYGFITCNGINLMQILFLSEVRAFYFFEGGIAFELQRLPSAGKAANGDKEDFRH